MTTVLTNEGWMHLSNDERISPEQNREGIRRVLQQPDATLIRSSNLAPYFHCETLHEMTCEVDEQMNPDTDFNLCEPDADYDSTKPRYRWEVVDVQAVVVKVYYPDGYEPDYSQSESKRRIVMGNPPEHSYDIKNWSDVQHNIPSVLPMMEESK